MITEKVVDVTGNRFWSVISEPDEYPVTVEEIKEFARIDGNDEDSILESFLIGAISDVEAYLRRSLVTRSYRMVLDEWNFREIEIPMPPLQSVTKVVTIDEEDVETEYSSDQYYTISSSIPGRLQIKMGYSLPSNTEREKAGHAIDFTAGYGGAEDIPKQIKIGIMQLVTMIYENRAMMEEIPNEVKKILRPFKVVRI